MGEGKKDKMESPGDVQDQHYPVAKTHFRSCDVPAVRYPLRRELAESMADTRKPTSAQ
jgi:hypothetical protein